MFSPRKPLVKKPKHTLAAFDKRQRQERNRRPLSENVDKQQNYGRVKLYTYGHKTIRHESSFDVRV